MGIERLMRCLAAVAVLGLSFASAKTVSVNELLRRFEALEQDLSSLKIPSLEEQPCPYNPSNPIETLQCVARKMNFLLDMAHGGQTYHGEPYPSVHTFLEAPNPKFTASHFPKYGAQVLDPQKRNSRDSFFLFGMRTDATKSTKGEAGTVGAFAIMELAASNACELSFVESREQNWGKLLVLAAISKSILEECKCVGLKDSTPRVSPASPSYYQQFDFSPAPDRYFRLCWDIEYHDAMTPDHMSPQRYIDRFPILIEKVMGEGMVDLSNVNIESESDDGWGGW